MRRNEIVELRKKQTVTTSLVFAEEFDLKHKHVLEKIRKYRVDFSAVKNQFEEGMFVDRKNKEQPMFFMNRDGYMTLVMNMSARGKALELLFERKQMFIKAFNNLEKMVLKEQTNKGNIEWTAAREQGKAIRLETTDIIKRFVEYAEAQGSNNARMYYMNITKMQYRALDILEQGKPKVRDVLSILEIGSLSIAENIVKDGLERYMQEGKHYKEIYLLCKQDVEEFYNKYCTTFKKIEIKND